MYFISFSHNAFKEYSSQRFEAWEFTVQVKYLLIYYSRDESIESLKIVDFGLSASIKEG